MNIKLNQRRKHYVDHRIQGTLIATLVILEITMVVAVLFYLNAQFDQLLENTLYSIHPPTDDEVRNQIYWEIGKTVVWMSVINICALALAHVLWGYYVKKVMTSFRQGVSVMGDLQFSKPLEHVELHSILHKLSYWQQREKAGSAEINAIIEGLQKEFEYEDNLPSVVSKIERVKSLCKR